MFVPLRPECAASQQDPILAGRNGRMRRESVLNNTSDGNRREGFARKNKAGRFVNRPAQYIVYRLTIGSVPVVLRLERALLVTPI